MDFLGGSVAGFRREMDRDCPAELRRHEQGLCRAESDRHLPVDSQNHCQRGWQGDSRAGSQSGLLDDFGGELRRPTDSRQNDKSARHTMERTKAEE
jgi:hypothetical protein